MLKITKGQQQALLRKWRQSDQGMTYRQFRRSAEKMVCDPTVHHNVCNEYPLLLLL